MKKQKVAVIGLGYVGLPLAIAIQKSKKYKLIGFDIDQSKIDQLNAGVCYLEDDFIKEEFRKHPVNVGTDVNELTDTDIFIIAVPTPVTDDYVPDYTPVIKASETAAQFLKKGATVVLESTVNPGTCEEIVLPILEKISKLKGKRDFNLTHCPERINPGDPKWNVYNIPRNVGSLDLKRNKEIADFYRSIIDAEINEVSSLKIAESTKIIENTFRDINIAYVNELAKSFDAMGIDLIETIKAASNKPFGYMPHWPGAGVGGHCIAVDPYYLIQRAAKSNFNHKFLKMARSINNSMPRYAIQRLEEALKEAKLSRNKATIAMLGISYKADVADLRESPSLEIKSLMKKEGIKTIIYDPYFLEQSDFKTLAETLAASDGVLLATAHKEFLSLDGQKLKNTKQKFVIDGRNALDKADIIDSNIIYKGIGR
ncbi:nucleotide sugar dehydrogenase [Candidatus Dojkabacteria bacterium]|nr:nucleotide sugar dehydrogenase [Candidatus Dojkabacteria bacterium]